MASENDKDVILVFDGMGGFIFSEFQNAFDAMYAGNRQSYRDDVAGRFIA